jgi:hypothetical protein
MDSKGRNMTCRDIQRAELAGKTKLTAVTMGHGTHKVQRFVMVKHDERGHAILTPSQVVQVQVPLNLRRGDTFTTG